MKPMGPFETNSWRVSKQHVDMVRLPPCYLPASIPNQCVMCRLQDANFLGYDTILVEDCTATSSPSYCYDATLFNVRACFGFTATSGAIIDGLGLV